LHFDNAQKFFPVDFEEVVVSREIRRDGQNRYFLNQSEILLRDLIDFFAKARLGSRGLVVIGQGDSDLFVRSTPIERREMIEEILGFREYQLKKSDAERRLKNSRINLEKVQALVEEIVPHLRSLKRQTGRWERRAELEAELRELENQFFGAQLDVLRGKTDEITLRLRGDEARRKEFSDRLREAEAAQAKVEAGRPEEQKGLARLKHDIRALIERKNDLQKNIGRLEAQMEMAPRAAAPQSDKDAKKLRELMAKIKEELEAVINGGDSYEIHTTVETVIEELLWALDDVSSGAVSTEDGAASISPELKRDFERLANDLRAIDRELMALREQEDSFEKNQGAFYETYRAAVLEVQAAKNALDAWERGNREQALEKERLDVRHAEIVHQIEQAGRREIEFGAVKAGASTHASADVLEKAVADLTGLMAELSNKITREFDGSLRNINAAFEKFFGIMFGGGYGKLKMKNEKLKIEGKESGEGMPPEVNGDEEDDESNLGVEIEVRLPRKKTNSLDMLSGGERSLVGIAALFALVSVSPPPFLVLDEIDAPLDERNARRFAEMLKDFSKRTQFIVVTHNRATMEAADILYGVTLNEDGTSKVLSLKLEPEIAETAVGA
jgi:chromosome segregation protein